MEPIIIALSIVLLLFSVIVHEVAHGLAALHFGDRTAQNAGRLTLNPIPHIDPIGTILLPGMLLLSARFFQGGLPFFIAWAKPVPVNPLNFDNIRKGELAVSLAGVGANFGLALLGAVLFHISSTFSNSALVPEILSVFVIMNLMLGVFNLLPIPPLDGAKVVMSQLPYQAAREWAKIEQYGPFILIALLLIQVGGTSIIGLIIGFFVNILRGILGV